MDKIIKRVGRGIVEGALWLYTKVVFRMKVIGKENVPKDGALILCGNHKSFIDPPLIQITCGRYARFLAKEELTKNKFFALLRIYF